MQEYSILIGNDVDEASCFPANNRWSRTFGTLLIMVFSMDLFSLFTSRRRNHLGDLAGAMDTLNVHTGCF